MTASIKAGLAELIDRAARLAGQRIAGGRIDSVREAVSELPDDADLETAAAAAWRSAGLDGMPLALHGPTPADLPFIAFVPAHGWLLLQSRSATGWRGIGSDGDAREIASGDGMSCLSLPRRTRTAAAVPGALALVRQTLRKKIGVFGDAVLATALVTLLALATSLYSMQVFDRVIPNQGFQTLWVLTVGVLLSILLEFLLKQVRSHTVDRACKAVDGELSQWFFRRMMGIRMEARPASVGTLAAQVKGFEMVRAVLASTSLFVLADVPFSILLVGVIAMVGGWVVLVPLVALPVALCTGLLFQRAIRRATRQSQAVSNRSAGLLVEAVDGAESLKSQCGEWAVQARWNALVDEAGAADQEIRKFTSLSQNMTVTLQQISYVALIAAGAWLVTDNALTMGGLLACSILGNRAMAPIMQLPGVMVQWAHARAAIEGLDKIIGLPNEADEAATALAPQALEGMLRLERVRFGYGNERRMALEIGQLNIRPGERVGLLGAIGSGKSTLLKLLSGLYRPAEGRVFLGGMDQALLAAAVLRENVGYLPQDARLFSGTLRDNLLLGLPDPGEEAILAAARRTGLIDLILGQPKGLALEITEGGRGVSGGQKQLIAMTRLLLARPKVWLLDEPTGAMDSVTEGRLVQLLRELAAEGATIVAATHKTALLPLVDRLIVLQEGRVLFDGPRDAVLARLSGRQPQPASEGALA